MSHVGNELNIKRVRFKTSSNPTETTGLVVGEVPDASFRGIYLDGRLIGPDSDSNVFGNVGTLQEVTTLGIPRMSLQHSWMLSYKERNIQF